MTSAALGYRVVSVEINERRVRELKMMVTLNTHLQHLITVHHVAAGDDNSSMFVCHVMPFGWSVDCRKLEREQNVKEQVTESSSSAAHESYV
jgi:hypothetical protein